MRGVKLGEHNAGQLKRETTLTMRAIATRLHMDSWKSASTRLQQFRRKGKQPENMPLS